MVPLVDEQVFAPERAKLRTEALYSVIGMVVVGPALLWWKDVPLRWWLPCLALALLVALGQDLWGQIRGRDYVYIVPEGIRVTNRRKVWLLRWQEIQTVHRFKDQLVFETVPPHRRETLSLDGHEAHHDGLYLAIASRARVLNLRWVQTLGDLL